MAVLFNQENADKLIRHKVEYVEEWDYCTPDQISALYDVLSGPVLDLMITKAKGTFSKEQIKKLKEKISLKTLELIDPKCEWDEECGSSNHYEYDSASAHAPDSRSEPLSDPGFVSALVGETLRLIRQRRKG